MSHEDETLPGGDPYPLLETGSMLNDRYEIMKRIGGGPTGSVYQARDKRLADNLRAVKEMIELFADEDGRVKAVQDFALEAQTLASLEHRSIPPIFDYFVEGRRCYVVMKFVPGDTLAEQMRKQGGRVDELTAGRWAIQICDALHYLRGQDPPIVYRVLEPANLMIDDRTNQVILIDFGIARVLDPGYAVGTPGYAAPELLAGAAEPRSDIYGLGATLFHLLTGSDPRDDPHSVFDFERSPRPTQINPALTSGMERIVMKAVAYAPEDRYASALEMKRALGDLERNVVRPGQATQPGLSPSCDTCGARLEPDDPYCPNGCALPGEQVGPPGAARLVVVGESGGESGEFLLGAGNHVIGRPDPHTGFVPEIDISPFDLQTTVSRRHARVYCQGRRYFVQDMSSVSGTTINGTTRLPPLKRRALESGDEIKVGALRLRFVLDDPERGG